MHLCIAIELNFTFPSPEQQAFGLFDLMGKLSPEGQKYYAETVSNAFVSVNTSTR